MSEEVSKTESGLSEKDQKILSMLTPGERIILERLLELHPSDEAFDLFEMMRSEKPGEEIPTYYFSDPDPYFERESLPADHIDREKQIDESGTLHVQNFSANELPEITLTKEIGGTVYTVTGSYDGIELLDKKLERIMEQNMTGAEAEECARKRNLLLSNKPILTRQLPPRRRYQICHGQLTRSQHYIVV